MEISGYTMHEKPYRKANAAFNKYPAIEVYGKEYTNEQSIMQIYTPVVKK
jgi:predicted transcriptional regulator YdeE